MFVHYNGKVINSQMIDSIDYSSLIKFGIVKVFIGTHSESVQGQEAYNLIQKLCPTALEGHQAKYYRHAWAIHNLIGHPVMQILSWLHLPGLGIQVHDLTVPMPKKAS